MKHIISSKTEIIKKSLLKTIKKNLIIWVVIMRCKKLTTLTNVLNKQIIYMSNNYFLSFTDIRTNIRRLFTELFHLFMIFSSILSQLFWMAILSSLTFENCFPCYDPQIFSMGLRSGFKVQNFNFQLILDIHLHLIWYW